MPGGLVACARALLDAGADPDSSWEHPEFGTLGALYGAAGVAHEPRMTALLLGLGEPLIGRILSYDALEQSFREYKLRVDPTNPVTYENRDRIQIRDLEGLCAPWVDDH